MLSRDIVEFIGLRRIFQLGRQCGVKVVKCVSPTSLLASTGETQNAAIGCPENLQLLVQQIIRECHSHDSLWRGEHLNQQHRDYAMLESEQQHANGQQQKTYEGQPDTYPQGNATHLKPRVVEQLQVNEITMRYVNEFRSKDAAPIAKSCQVELEWTSSTEQGSVMLTIVGLKAESDVKRAKNKLAQICMEISNTVDETRLPMPKETYRALKAQVDLKAYHAFMSHEYTEEGAVCVIMGPKENVRATEKKVKAILKQLQENAGICLASLTIKGRKISVKKGNLTLEPVDAIVNAANDCLQHGGGVAMAIVEAGGKVIQDESDDIIRMNGRLKTGDAAYTKGGRLPCTFVIHAVPPVWNDYQSSATIQKLQLACSNALKIASELKAKSVAMPGLGSGLFRIPKDQCALALFTAVEDFFRQASTSTSVTDVIFINIDYETAGAFEKECKRRAAALSQQRHNGK